jgi:phage shock protein C
MEPKRFYRSTIDKKIAGVAGGLAEYFEIDSLLVRLIFVILALAGGGGILIYIILWIITPEKPFVMNQTQNSSDMENQQSNYGDQKPPEENQFQKSNRPNQRNRGNLIGGLVLITLGILFLADEFIPQISFGDLWPVILIVIGAGLLINSFGRRKS